MRVLIADDAILFRRLLEQVLSTIPGVEVVGQAPNGKVALQRIQQLRPDVITLDVEMPELDGLGVLDALRSVNDPPAVIMVSALTLHGGALTMRALQRGAFDFITKPEGADAEKSRAALLGELAPRIRTLELRLGVRGILRGGAETKGGAMKSASSPAPVAPPADASSFAPSPGRRPLQKPELVLIGVSTGGPTALATLLPGLPAHLGVPVLVVQHMPPLFTQSLAENLDGKCALRVKEASHQEPAEANTVYIAPGGRQMRVNLAPDGRKLIQITDDPPESNCKPAVDYLFRSAANHFPGRAMAVILTGMGSDGTLGLRLLKRQGCFTIAQDEATCVVYGMPKAAVEAGVVDQVLPVGAIAARIAQCVTGSIP